MLIASYIRLKSDLHLVKLLVRYMKKLQTS